MTEPNKSAERSRVSAEAIRRRCTNELSSPGTGGFRERKRDTMRCASFDRYTISAVALESKIPQLHRAAGARVGELVEARGDEEEGDEDDDDDQHGREEPPPE